MNILYTIKTYWF